MVPSAGLLNRPCATPNSIAFAEEHDKVPNVLKTSFSKKPESGLNERRNKLDTPAASFRALPDAQGFAEIVPGIRDAFWISDHRELQLVTVSQLTGLHHRASRRGQCQPRRQCGSGVLPGLEYPSLRGRRAEDVLHNTRRVAREPERCRTCTEIRFAWIALKKSASMS